MSPLGAIPLKSLMPLRGTMNDEIGGAISGEARWQCGPEMMMKIEHLPVLPTPLGDFRRNAS